MTDPSVSNLTIPAKLPSKSPSKLDSESVVLNRKRGVIKGRLTKLQKYVESFIAQPSNLFKAEFKLRMQGASSLLSDFNEIQSKIEERSDDIDEQLDYREEFETTYYNIIAKAHVDSFNAGGMLRHRKFTHLRVFYHEALQICHLQLIRQTSLGPPPAQGHC
ncbi:hypothetical protein ACJJTC_002175 [Scirpophaga incertulas]